MDVCNIPAKATRLLCSMQKGRYRIVKGEVGCLSWSSTTGFSIGAGRLGAVVEEKDDSLVDRPYHVPRIKTVNTPITPSPSQVDGRALSLHLLVSSPSYPLVLMPDELTIRGFVSSMILICRLGTDCLLFRLFSFTEVCGNANLQAQRGG